MFSFFKMKDDTSTAMWPHSDQIQMYSTSLSLPSQFRSLKRSWSLLSRVVHERTDVALVRAEVDSVDDGRDVLLWYPVQRVGDEVVLEDAVGVPHLILGERCREKVIGLQA